ncbi:MAG: carbamoyltransferase HypF, partial [Micrococcales bacterium]|nr:carbamoyltransferase HypF [Micrococcales bacterium]
MARRTLTVTGVVQGVGFRPHVYRLAVRLGVAGSVRNTPTGVVVVAQAPAPVLEELTRQIVTDPPPLADVRTVHADGPDEPDDPALTSFAIVASAAAVGPRATVPPDCAVCDDCLAELFDPDDRRYRHPFITCTNCGPRFTIITGVPYDRRKTSMAAFSMCPRCRAEYDDPADRRFHAQPVACPDCGPHLWTDDGSGVRTSDDETAIGLAQQVLADGGTVAVKGLGGYHLACRPEQEAVTRLRTRKNRPDKPFALMVADLAAAARLVELDEPTTALLADPSRPVVLVPRRDRMAVAAAADGAPDGGLVVAAGVAPGSPELGVMLAYTPLHHLLLRPGPSGAPVSDVLVMTSANLSDEPLCYRDDTDALLAMADLVLGHDRPIVTPCDDSVFRVVDDQPYPVRRSRGHTPLPVPVCRGVPASPGVCGPWTWPATFAVGAELKNTVCVLDGHEAVCSQHLGDMAGWESLQVLAATSAHVMDLYEVSPTRWAADAHPGYQTRAWALRFADVPLVEVQHHRAHV